MISFLRLPVIIQNPELFSKTLVIWLVIIGKGQLVECDNTCDLSAVIGNNNKKKVSSYIYLLTAHSSLRIFQIMLRLQTSTKNMNFDTPGNIHEYFDYGMHAGSGERQVL